MLKRYSVEYSLCFLKHSPPERYSYYTDEPAACEEFVQELLERGLRLHAIRHESLDLPQPEFDRIVRLAASRLATKCIGTSLGLEPADAQLRFGFTI